MCRRMRSRGRRFQTLQEQNEHLRRWESNVADTRIHGTTKRQVGQVFRGGRAAGAAPLPAERFANFHEAQRKVNRDGHVEVAKAYYSVPPEYLGRDGLGALGCASGPHLQSAAGADRGACAARAGSLQHAREHLAVEKISGIERGAAWLLSKVSAIGPHAHGWACAMLKSRGIAGMRVLQGLLALAKRMSSADIERACEVACSYQAFHLRASAVDRTASSQAAISAVA